MILFHTGVKIVDFSIKYCTICSGKEGVPYNDTKGFVMLLSNMTALETLRYYDELPARRAGILVNEVPPQTTPQDSHEKVREFTAIKKRFEIEYDRATDLIDRFGYPGDLDQARDILESLRDYLVTCRWNREKFNHEERILLQNMEDRCNCLLGTGDMFERINELAGPDDGGWTGDDFQDDVTDDLEDEDSFLYPERYDEITLTGLRPFYSDY